MSSMWHGGRAAQPRQKFCFVTYVSLCFVSLCYGDETRTIAEHG